MASTNNDILCDTNSEDDVPLASINSDYIYQSEDNEDEHQSEDNQDEHQMSNSTNTPILDIDLLQDDASGEVDR